MRISFGLLTIYLLALSNCSNSAHRRINKDPAVKALRLYSSLPIGYADGSSIYWTDSIDIYFYEDMVVYKNYVENRTQLMGLNETKDTMISKQESIHISNTYYGAKNDAEFGYYFDQTNPSRNHRISIDSMKLKKSIYFEFDKLYQSGTKSETMILVSKKVEKNNLLEKYIPIIKLDKSWADTSTFYYTSRPAINEIPFSLSKMADSTKKMKLYKFIGIFKGDPNGYDDFSRGAKQIIVEFKEIQIENSREILNIFDQTKKKYLEDKR